MALSVLLLALVFAFDWPVAVAVVALCAVMLCFSLGPGPLTNVVLNELLPLHQRAKVAALATAVNRLTSAAVALTFLTLSRRANQGSNNPHP